jgi:S1-C subfamily serine protease/photosystem II stability/assembly factor-like uncharacterized protein
VSPLRRIPFSLILAGCFFPGLLILAIVPAPTHAEEPSVQQRIASVEKQIADLQKQLAELRKLAVTPAPRPPEGILPDAWAKQLNWRSIGPATMGGRIVTFAVYEADPTTYWIASAGGGLLRTTNNGVTFEHQFDRETSVSIGDVQVAPSDRNIVWVGTGENNPRNSVSYGDGVYKSTNGGKTWQNMGLKGSFQIGRIAIHPKNPDIVYVGALGRLYGPNEERGLFKTTDGGKTWKKILYVDDRTGVIDLQMNPRNPETLIAATWERQRDGYDSHPGPEPMKDGYDGYDPIKKWGPGSALWKTTDGGKNWKKLTKGLPSCHLGRIGIDHYRKNPNVLFAIIDSEKIGKGTPPSPVFMGIQGEDDKAGAKLIRITPNGPAAKAGLKDGDIITAAGGKPIKNYADLARAITSRKPGDQLKLSILRGKEKKEITVTLGRRPESQGGRPLPPRALLARLTGLAIAESKEGLKVETVVPDRPADKAGIKVGDQIEAIDRMKVTKIEELLEKLRDRKSGDKVVLTIRRGKETKQLTLALAGRPSAGVYVGLFGEETKEGLKVTQIAPSSPAEKAGLKPGDVIKAAEKKPINKLAQITELTQNRKAGDKLTLTIQRGKEKKDVVVVLAERPAQARRSPTRPWGVFLGGQRENIQDQQGPNSHEYGGVYRSADGGETWTRINSLNSRPMYFSQIRVDPTDEKYLYVLGVALYRSHDGGKTFKPDGGNRVHPDQHALWIDPRDSRHMLVGTDGGAYVSYDRMEHWDFLNHAALGQFYHVCVDNRQPYRVFGGLQDNGSWGGPSRSLNSTGILNDDWFVVGGGDGFVCRVDRDDPDVTYFESQDGNMQRYNLKTGKRASLRPRQQRGQPGYRFNWNTPFILSHHNPQLFYSAGNYVFRSYKRGENQKPISPEITRTKDGSGTALSESPLNPDVLWAGTDDGYLWLTKDGGRNWINLTSSLLKAGVPGPRWVASIEASRFKEGRAYVVLDAHRSDDDNPYVLTTEDFGETWKSLRSNLPWGSTRVLREDVENQNLLYLGTEFGMWVSINRGDSWTRANNNLPTVAVHEIAIHPTAGEIVVATHGRSLWVLDVSALRQIKPSTLDEKVVLFRPQTAIRWRPEPQRGSPYGNGSRRFAGQNPPRGAGISYALDKKASKLTLKVVDYAGKTLRELKAPADAGFHRVEWNLTRLSVRVVGRNRQPFSAPVDPGVYHLVLTVDGKEFSQALRVEADPTLPGIVVTEDENAEKQEREEEERERGWLVDD